MKPNVSIVSTYNLSESTIGKIANHLGSLCDSPSWTVSVYQGHSMPVYTFTSTRATVPMNRYCSCKAYTDGIQFGINHA